MIERGKPGRAFRVDGRFVGKKSSCSEQGIERMQASLPQEISPTILCDSTLLERGRVPKWTKGTDCKSVIRGFESHLGLSTGKARTCGLFAFFAVSSNRIGRVCRHVR